MSGSTRISWTGLREKASVVRSPGEGAAGRMREAAGKVAPRAGSRRRFRRCNGAGSDGLAEPLLQLAPSAAAQLDLRPVLEEHHLLPLEIRLDLANPVEVDDRRAVDPEEAAGIEAFPRGLHRVPNAVDPAAGVELDAVVGRLDPVEVLDPDEEDPSAGPDYDPILESPDRKSTRLNSSHGYISYAVFCLKK